MNLTVKKMIEQLHLSLGVQVKSLLLAYDGLFVRYKQQQHHRRSSTDNNSE